MRNNAEIPCTLYPIFPKVTFCKTIVQQHKQDVELIYFSYIFLLFVLKNYYQIIGKYYIIREGNGTPLQYSCLENPMDGGAWWAAVRGVAKSRTRLSNFTFTFHFHALEKEMATHSSVLVWRIPGTGKPDRLPSMGLHGVGHD